MVLHVTIIGPWHKLSCHSRHVEKMSHKMTISKNAQHGTVVSLGNVITTYYKTYPSCSFTGFISSDLLSNAEGSSKVASSLPN